ncbi:hypothetical protein BD560DRAFT_347133 [Blakeslea trispora]|nr:hypothetical protein BD560DRAFT_347133 [Blakeslea trispora]
MKTSTIALISTAVIASFGIGYLIHFDHQRRHNPEIRKQKKFERKKAAKEEKELKQKELESVESLIQSVLDNVSKEKLPTTAEAIEAYFVDQIALGEECIKQGNDNASVEHFYKALKVYPAPLELIMIYQKTVPEKIYRMIVTLMAMEQQQRQNKFYEEFPPPEVHLKLKESAREGEESTFELVADKNIKAGEHLYTEKPLVSALYPQLQGFYCHDCMKKLDNDKQVECANCDLVKYCSHECEQRAAQEYHQFLCTNNKISTGTKALDFYQFSLDNKLKYPQMIAQFLSSMVAEEVEKKKATKTESSVYTNWDHIERFKSDTLEISEESIKETTLIKEILSSKIPGLDEFLKDDIYLLMKSKLMSNCFEVATEEQVDILVDKSKSESARILKENQYGLGSAVYKISSYITSVSDADESNVSLTFKDNTHDLVVVAHKDIAQGEKIKVHAVK